MTGKLARRLAKPLAHAALALPLMWLLAHWGLILTGETRVLGANPVEATVRFLGDWAIRVLLLALAVSPAAHMFKRAGLMALRRMVGLWAFAYVSLHLLGYLGMDLLFDWAALWRDLLKRSYIALGMMAFVLLTPLAATSTNTMIKRLGARRWRRLHRLVYPAALLAVLHHGLMVKGVQPGPFIHGGVLALLLGYRLYASRLRKNAACKA
ncbi:MAG: sulfoxide reductase heme-binding subunit YedZ [Sphingomonadales bacterium]